MEPERSYTDEALDDVADVHQRATTMTNSMSLTMTGQ
jgi:hypothetical protein